MALFIAFALIVLLGLLAAIRLAPSDPAVWNEDPAAAFPAEPPAGQVLPLTGGALLFLPADAPQAAAQLARLDAIAGATPRTERLAGSPEAGRITWITRSAAWGFPDYTTAGAGPGGIYIHARLRFGRSDLGVNAARLRDWQSRL